MTPAPLEGQRGVVVGLAGRALTLELFGTSTLFARHWEQFANALRFDAWYLGHDARQTPGQAARNFVSTLAAEPGHLFSTPTRRHGDVASTVVHAAVGGYAYSGLAVQRAQQDPQFAQLSVWDAAHPFALA